VARNSGAPHALCLSHQLRPQITSCAARRPGMFWAPTYVAGFANRCPGICAACGAGTAGATAMHNAGCAKAQFSEWRSHLREQIC